MSGETARSQVAIPIPVEYVWPWRDAISLIVLLPPLALFDLARGSAKEGVPGYCLVFSRAAVFKYSWGDISIAEAARIKKLAATRVSPSDAIRELEQLESAVVERMERARLDAWMARVQFDAYVDSGMRRAATRRRRP